MDRYEQRRYEDNEGDRYDVINHTPTHDELVTKSGRVLTDADIQALADEAERGYEVYTDDEGRTRVRPWGDDAPYCDYCERTGHTFSTCPARDDE